MIKYLDGIAEKVSLQLAKLFFKAKIKPLPVTLFRFVIAAPASWYFFSRGQYIYNVIGLFIYMALAILDWVDGELAQLYKLPKRTKPFGRLIDHTSDRILMLIVLGSIFYAGMRGPNSYIWIILTVLYYSFFFFLTVSQYEFEKMFKMNFERFPEIGEEMLKINSSPGITDKILFNLLYVHNNSWTRICFTHNYLLIIGIITNQLLLAFIFITMMHIFRSAGIFFIVYRTLRIGETNSALVKVMRKYKTLS